ncbi:MULTISPECIES: DUF1801 domain-containing protein [unclassified Pseudoxanthomonas]|uniref:DUF1801 domain-containing protein n=1 Tax=unclassified Pseudoxanthomonas TaxID=2645906 RepID=UPI003077C836
MTGKTTKKSAKVAKVAKKTATKPAEAKATKPRKTADKSAARKSTKAPAKAKKKPSPARVASPKTAASKSNAPAKTAKKPALLSGGNPQIPKGYGDGPVKAYIAAMPGWKSKAGRRLDALIARSVPKVHKAVKWNSPFYGTEDDSWFLSYHCFAKYIKVAFFRGASLHPVPPVKSKHKDVRYLHIHEDEPLDEARFADWVKQASELPGERM